MVIAAEECKACCDPLRALCSGLTAAHMLQADDTARWDVRAFPSCKQQYYLDRAADALWRIFFFKLSPVGLI